MQGQSDDGGALSVDACLGAPRGVSDRQALAAAACWVPDLALKFLDPVLRCARQTSARTGITVGLLTPGTQIVGRAARLRRYCLPGSRVAGMVSAVRTQQPNAARAARPDRRGWIVAVMGFVL